MATWDTYEDLKKALNLHVLANPEVSFVLVMVHASDDERMAVAHACANLSSAVAVGAADDQLADLMSMAAAANGMEVEDPPTDDLPD